MVIDPDQHIGPEGMAPTCGWAIASLLLSLLSIPLLCIFYPVMVTSLVAAIIGVVALIKIKRSDGELSGNTQAIMGISLGTFLFLGTTIYYFVLINMVVPQ